MQMLFFFFFKVEKKCSPKKNKNSKKKCMQAPYISDDVVSQLSKNKIFLLLPILLLTINVLFSLSS